MERALSMPEELIQQEYFCDFSVANVGAIVGRLIAEAEKAGRINVDTVESLGSKIVVSSDLGYRDAAAFWFWQLRRGGFDLIHYDEASGLDAGEWVDRLNSSGFDIETLYLPHDAKAKTMATQHSVIEIFAQHFHCEMVPKSKMQDRINAARVVLPRCHFHADNCARGLEALRSWSFKWDDERKVFSSEPNHDWASHGADAFSYGAQMVIEQVIPMPAPKPAQEAMGNHYAFSLDQLWRDIRRVARI
jgi:phage terminase large subunit